MHLTSYRSQPEVVDVLSLSIGFPTPAKVQALLTQYRDEPNLHLLCYEVEGRVAGCIGLVLEEESRAELRHIAVAPSYRRQNIGRRMIEAMVSWFQLHHLRAETDAEAVGFYRNCGFAVTSLGPSQHGFERFHCERSIG